MTLTQQDFTSENLRELEQDAERLAASLELAANELRVGVIDVGLSQVSRDLAEFVRAFDSAAKAVGSGTRSLDDLRKALDRRQGRSTLERALRIQGTVAVDLDAVGTVVQAALDEYPPQPEIIAAIEALLALIEDPELDFQRKMALGEQAGRILQKDVVLAAQLGGLTLAVASPEVVLSVDSSQEPLSTDPDPSLPAPEVDEAPQDVGSILNPYRRPELPKEPRLVSSASVAEFKKLK